MAHLTAERHLNPRDKGWSLDVMPPLREQEILFYANLKPEFKRGTPRHRPTLFQTMSMPPLASISSDGSVSVSVNVSSGSGFRCYGAAGEEGAPSSPEATTERPQCRG